MPNLFIGIDPGASGGIALLDRTGQVVELHKTPPMLQGLTILMERWTGADLFVMVERVGGFMGVGEGDKKVNVAAAHTMFEFGRKFGHLEALLLAHHLPHEFVQPAVWQKTVGVEPKRKDESKGMWKVRLREHARTIHDYLKGDDVLELSLATADAVLIATYCWMTKRTV